MVWSFRIGKEKGVYGIVEVFYRNKYKINGYSDFLCTGNSKQGVINDLKKILKNNLNKGEVELSYSKELYSLQEIHWMINDSKKRKVLDLEDIKNISKKGYK